MNARQAWTSSFKTLPLLALSIAGFCVMAACSGVKSGSAISGSGGGGGGSSATNNLAVQVNLGPGGNDLNFLFASVEICIHGTSNCQTIPDVQVDTGSTGLRLLGSEVTLSLPAVTDASGNPVAECVQFVDMSYAWGSVNVADIKLAGEVASSVPIQIISPSGFAPVNSNCIIPAGQQLDSQATLHSNGIIGVGLFTQDCGNACATAPPPAKVYFSCVAQVCNPNTVALANQVQNPVSLFTTDNNGVLINLPSVPATGSATVSGSLIFGIGTESNNALGTAIVYTTSATGDFTVTYSGTAYPQSFVDSGSNALFFLDSVTSGLATCAPNAAFYCPASTTPFTVTPMGQNGNSGSLTFSIANIDSLVTANPTFAAYSNAGGPFPGAFDLGLAFFYGRPVFVAIEGKTTPGGSGPFYAF